MPASNAFTGFSTNGGEETSSYGVGTVDSSRGWNFRNKKTGYTATIYFPAGKYRDNRTTLYPEGELDHGYYVTAIPFNTHYACGMLFAPWMVLPKHRVARGGGHSVRPVAE